MEVSEVLFICNSGCLVYKLSDIVYSAVSGVDDTGEFYVEFYYDDGSNYDNDDMKYNAPDL